MPDSSTNDHGPKTAQGRLRKWLTAHTDGITAFLLGTTAFVCLSATLTQVGIGRDEALYMVAGETYWHWAEGAGYNWSKMKKRGWIDRHYGFNSEHPPLVKHLAGLSWRIFHRCRCRDQRGLHRIGNRVEHYAKPHRTLGLMSETAAFRLPTAMLSSVLVAFIYLLGAGAFGRLAGLAAALLYIAMPRVFFHSRLASLDAPITAMSFLAVYAYWKALHSARWIVPAGLLFGLALSTKLNSFFLPIIMAVHYAWASRDQFRSAAHALAGLALIVPAMLLLLYFGGSRASIPLVAGAVLGLMILWATRKEAFHRPLHAIGLLIPWLFVAQVVLGFGILYLLWPHLWPDPFHRLSGYMSYHLYHVFYNTEYFGRNYSLPPFPISFPFVMTLLTIPTTTCLLALGGIGVMVQEPVRKLVHLIRRSPAEETETSNAGPNTESGDRPGRPRSPTRPLLGVPRCEGFLVVLFALFPLVLIALPSTPIFGGTRNWMPAMPFIALLAGACLAALVKAAQERLGLAASRARIVAMASLVCAFLPGLAQTVHAGNLAPSYYVPFAGGARGGADLGMKRQYWGYASRELLDWAGKNLPRNTRLYLHDTIYLARHLYARDRMLREDIRESGGEYWGVSTSRYAFFLYEKHQVMWEFLIWQEYGTFKPISVLTLDGVPLVTIYGPRGKRMGPPYFMDPPHLSRRPSPPRRR